MQELDNIIRMFPEESNDEDLRRSQKKQVMNILGPPKVVQKDRTLGQA